jgi:hypothetical protein
LDSGGWRNDVAHALKKGGGVELSAKDLVRAVGHDGDPPVTDEGDQLLMLSGLDLGAEMLGVWDAGLSFYVDQDEIIVAGPEHGESFGVADGRVDVKSCERQNPVAKRTDRFAGADVKDCVLVIYGSFHCYVVYRLFATRGRSACIPAKNSRGQADSCFVSTQVDKFYLTGGSMKLS